MVWRNDNIDRENEQRANHVGQRSDCKDAEAREWCMDNIHNREVGGLIKWK